MMYVIGYYSRPTVTLTVGQDVYYNLFCPTVKFIHVVRYCGETLVLLTPLNLPSFV